MQHDKMNIALVCDYFYPNKGGVETHIKMIGEGLIKLGHNVIVITHKYAGHKGAMQIGNLLVYYLDLPVFIMNTTTPTIFTNYILFKTIFEKHSIEIVHGHQSLSNLCLESIYHASNLNIKTVLTDHSVFEVAKFERVLVNNICSFLCTYLDFAISVSSVSKENTQLRLNLQKDKMAVIPNGIIPEIFYPKTEKYKIGEKIRLIVMCRLVFRKGLDLLIGALPLICKNKDIEILIVGDGAKKSEIEQTIAENELEQQVKILDEIKYEDVGDILRTGDLFLNTSLTETFCLAILEAISCGLMVISTNVGGIHELFSESEIYFCEPTADDIAEQVFSAARNLGNHDPNKIFNSIKTKCSWSTISKQIESVYKSIPNKKVSLSAKIRHFSANGGFLMTLATFYEYFQIYFFEMIESLVK